MRASFEVAKSLLPLRVRASLSASVSALRRLHRYPLTHRILRDHADYYRQARRLYRAEGGGVTRLFASVRDVGVRVHVPGGEPCPLQLSAAYLDLVHRMSSDVRRRMMLSANCEFYPSPEAARAFERTDATLAASEGATLSLHLRDPLPVDGLEELCSHLLPQVERTIYGSHAAVDKVYVYRSLVSHHPPEVSLLWHFDELPPQLLKIMIYLTEVDEGSAPFTYLRPSGPSTAVFGARRPLGGHSRISDLRIAGYQARGCSIQPVTGPRGTTILFHANVIHRGTVATHAYRDVVVLQIRPVCARNDPWVDARWTGSFQHAAFNHDPRLLAPTLE